MNASTPKRPPIVLLVVAAAIIAAIGFGLWRYSRFNDVWVLNGLPVAVDVSLDGKPVKVAPNNRTSFKSVGTGTHVVSASWEGHELETTLIFVKGGSHVLTYNIGGAAPLVWERIAYSTYKGNQEPQWQMYCGRRFVEHDGVDYAFTEPPRSISTKGGGTIYKTHLTVDEGGLKACQSWALDKGSPEMWSDWQRLEAKLDPKKAISAVEELARQGDFREAQLLLEQALAKEPSNDLHRLYQSVLVASGQREKAVSLYARDVNDPKATEVDLYLAARTLFGDAKLSYLDEGLKRFPDSTWLHFMRGYTLDRRGNVNGALADLDAAERSPPPAIEWGVLYSHLAALIHAKRLKEAWAAGGASYRDSTTIEGAATYWRLAQVTGNSTAGWDAKLKPHQQRWAQTLLGLPVVEPLPTAKDRDPESFKKARELIKLTLQPSVAPPPSKNKKTGLVVSGTVDTSPPRAALAQAGRAQDAELRLLPSSIVWLLLTEAWRTGETNAAAKLTKHALNSDAPRLDVATKFIATGELDPQLELVNDTELAVLWFARGRRLATLGESPKAAFDEARRLDVFQTVVWKALEQWPEAKAGQKLAWLPVTASTPAP